jgi:hypothetical protein
LGLNPESTKFLDYSSGGCFIDLTLNEGRVILKKILANTPYTRIYGEFLEEPPEMQPEEPSIETPEPKDATPSHTPAFTTTHISNAISEPVGHTPRVLMQGRKNSRRRTPSRIPLYSY